MACSIEEMNYRSTVSPRQLLAPEPKLLTGPSQSDTGSRQDSTPSSNDPMGNDGVDPRKMSEADLERLAKRVSELQGKARVDSRDHMPDDSEEQS